MKLLSLLVILFLVPSVLAIPFTPQGDIWMRNVYAMYNATVINGTLIYENNSRVCTPLNGLCPAGSGTGGGSFDSWFLASSGTTGSYNVTNASLVNFTAGNGMLVTRSGPNITMNASLGISIQTNEMDSDVVGDSALNYTEVTLADFTNDVPYVTLTNAINQFVNRSVWTTIDNYPVACSGNGYASQIGDTLTCSVPNGSLYAAGSGLTLTTFTFAVNRSALNDSLVNRTDWTTHDSYPTACTGNNVVSGLADTLTCVLPNGTLYSAGSGITISSFSIATKDSGHVHDAANLTSGTILNARYNTSYLLTVSGFEATNITSGSIPDARIANASTWHGKVSAGVTSVCSAGTHIANFSANTTGLYTTCTADTGSGGGGNATANGTGTQGLAYFSNASNLNSYYQGTSTTVLFGNATGLPDWKTIDLSTAVVTGSLPDARIANASTWHGKAAGGASAACTYGVANFTANSSGVPLVTCAAQQGNVTGVQAGNGLSADAGMGATPRLNISSPACNAITEKNIWNGSQWSCGTDGGGVGMTSWLLAASGSAGTESITDGELVTFVAPNGGLIITRGGNYTNFTVNQSFMNASFVNRSDWTSIDSYPGACGAGTYATTIGDTLTCTTPNGTLYSAGSGITISSFSIATKDSGHVHDAANLTSGTILNARYNTSYLWTVEGGIPLNNITVPDAIAFGGGTTSNGTDSIAIGHNAIATGDRTIAIGGNSRATSPFATALGYTAYATAYSAMALGDEAKAGGDASIALGDVAWALSNVSIAIGYSSVVRGNYSIAIGAYALNNYNDSVAIGQEATVTEANQMVIGSTNYSLNTYIFGTFNTSGLMYENNSRVCTSANGLCASSGGGNATANGTGTQGLAYFSNASNLNSFYQGTSTTVLFGNASGVPDWKTIDLSTAVVTGSLPDARIANASSWTAKAFAGASGVCSGGIANFTINSTGAPLVTCAAGGGGGNATANGTSTQGLSYFSNASNLNAFYQGTSGTLLHGNASGIPDWRAVDLGTETTGTLQDAKIGNSTVWNSKASSGTSSVCPFGIANFTANSSTSPLTSCAVQQAYFGANLTGNLTANYIPYAFNTTMLQDSPLSITASTVTSGRNFTVNGNLNVTGNINMSAAGTCLMTPTGGSICANSTSIIISSPNNSSQLVISN